MSLSKEAFIEANQKVMVLNDRVNVLLKQSSVPLENKVQMDHYGRTYLFGKVIKCINTDDELMEIIKKTPKKAWNGKIDFFGRWKV